VQPLESTQAAATTATSRFIAATPQFYERPMHQNPRNIVTMTASRVIVLLCDGTPRDQTGNLCERR
jgi:hypothetical protein